MLKSAEMTLDQNAVVSGELDIKDGGPARVKWSCGLPFRRTTGENAGSLFGA